ncbi:MULTISPECIES: TIR domain-containing protein [Streptomyces]|uniref:Transcriptional regulator n=3 Tax=Streptomyces TaxID=1883 RepID=A0ABM5QT58_STRLI|nr:MULTISPECIES: TIR domain-containing protein [Streptomyces]QSJ06552.1 transcriptional regulator [Streptomyces lividans]AIJ11052.1 transcriptional regulator [Streptomyces lividans TK24]AIJ18373.1 transcriptional regulator [Streptomyces lividans TK24]MBQ0954331.1 TIR domain-containing protein [Streptomyces sp. RK76]MDX3322021.1 TIR domain-containing protein [Streptomyces sp. ME03-5684b]
MRIFLSHTTRNKPLVREVRSGLPEHINAWIDEKDLLAGDSIQNMIRNAIQTDTDFLVVFVDDSVPKSTWVAKELEWARAEENRLGRPFIIPIIIEDAELGDLDWLRERLFLRCHGYTEADTNRLANELSSALFGWLSRDIERLRRPPEPDANDLALLGRADELLQATAQRVRAVVLPHRKSNPMQLGMLFDRLVSTGQVPLSSPKDLHDILFRLRERKLLSGVTIAGGRIYVEEEHLSWRLQESLAAKQAIAEFATNFINDGNVVFVDGGSTALHVCKNICRNLQFHAWESLTIVTNSPPVAAEFALLANELGLDDYDTRLQVFSVGGRMRMNAATVVALDGAESTIPALAEHLGGFDIALCGTNGIHWPGGCTTTSAAQAQGKRLALENSRRRVIMADASKYDVKQEMIFAGFDMGLEIITAPGGNRGIVEDLSSKIEGTGSTITLTP